MLLIREDLGRLKHEPRQAICMERPLKTAWASPRVGRGGASGNHQGGGNSVSQVDEASDMAPTCPLCGSRAQKRNNGLCQHFCVGEKLSPSSRPDARHCSSSLYVSGAFQAAALVLELSGSESK